MFVSAIVFDIARSWQGDQDSEEGGGGPVLVTSNRDRKFNTPHFSWRTQCPSHHSNLPERLACCK